MPRWTKHLWLAGLLLGAAAPPAFARPPAPTGPETKASVTDLDAKALADLIDRRLTEHWQGRVQPAPVADDATFMRRAYLDLTGRIPDLVPARDFLENPDPQKRAKLIEQLLANPRYAEHMANVYGVLLAPPSNDPMRPRAFNVEAWLMREFDSNTPYNEMVRKLLVVQPGDQNAFFFYQANEFKPENMAGATTRLFLGFKLECAQCHDHPMDVWTRKQFWEFAAFFSGIQPNQPQPNRTEIQIPGQGKTVKARFPDGTEPNFRQGVSPNVVLVEWMTGPDNPYFARAAVNRVWEYFFGIGIVDPVDELSEKNQPSHPGLQEELAQAFIAHKYDVKYLIRAIMMTQAYQRGSRITHPSQEDPRLFARMSVRGLSPEQFFDSLAQATRFDVEPTGADPYTRSRIPRPMSPARAEFLTRFPPGQDRRTEHQTSILQALYLMNGKLVADATSLENNRQLRYIADGTKVKTSRKVEQLYLIALSRKPRPEELERLVPYVEAGGPTGDSRKALADIFWALLNSSEFALNH
jgi:hypothetical protein